MTPNELISNYIQSHLDESKTKLLRFFDNHLYANNFQPDITGYTFISFIHPNLSGYFEGPGRVPGVKEFMNNVAKNFLFLATDFSPPETTINTTDFTSGSSIVLPYATSKRSGGQMAISYIENIDLNIYQFHLNWVNYINDVIYGDVEPSSEFFTNSNNNGDFGALDYAAAAYVIKYDPRLSKLSYIAKVIGLIPLNTPSKELIGNRESNQLTVIPMNYICADYVQLVFDDKGNPLHTNTNNDWLFKDFQINVLNNY